MDASKKMREEVKKYIDTADDKVVKMVHAMLEVDAHEDWWEMVPDGIKEQVELSLQQSESGEVLTHEDVKAKYPQWFAK